MVGLVRAFIGADRLVILGCINHQNTLSALLNDLAPPLTMAEITVSGALALAADAVYLANRPPPNAPTGFYDWEITTDPADDREGNSLLTNILKRVSHSTFAIVGLSLLPSTGSGSQSQGRVHPQSR